MGGQCEKVIASYVPQETRFRTVLSENAAQQLRSKEDDSVPLFKPVMIIVRLEVVEVDVDDAEGVALRGPPDELILNDDVPGQPGQRVRSSGYFDPLPMHRLKQRLHRYETFQVSACCDDE